MDTYKAKQILEGIPGVKVGEFMLGFSSIDSDYYVSTFHGKGIPLDYLDHTDDLTEKDKELSARVGEIMERLCGRGYAYDDVSEKDMVYDPEEDKIIVFDLINEFPDNE